MKAEEDHAHWVAVAERQGLPALPGETIDMRFNFGSQSWWAQTQDGWWWCDAMTKKEWKPSLYGPD